MKYRLILLITALLSLGLPSKAQELNCTVEVNSQKIEGTDKSIFEELQSALTEYVNTYKWTNAQFSANEKIECRMFLTISKYEDDKFTGDLQVQVIRPVYNSTYTTPLLNFKDSKVEFTYARGDQLNHNESSWESNLTAIIDFYANLFLALDFDSFSPLGGQPYFDRLASIVQMAQSSGEVGWRAFEDNKNRSAVLSAYTESQMLPVREMLYNYHRRGLDEMVTSPDKGRAAITAEIRKLSAIHQADPMSVALSIFRDTKLDELVNIYSEAPASEREEIYKILSPIYPTDLERLDMIKNPPTK